MAQALDPYFDALSRRAVANPDRVGFEFVRDGRVIALTRGGLLERIQRLGDTLRAQGRGEGAKVAILMENRPAWVVAYFSIWYAGGVCVPLDPQIDAVKVGRILAHADTALVVTSDKYRSKVDAAIAKLDSPPAVMNLDETGDLVWDGGAELPRGGATGAGAGTWEPRSSPDGLGVLVYTSGTTGDPKGVMLERAKIVEHMDTILSRVEFTEKDSVLGVLPLYHMLPLIANCIGPAYVGARTVFLDVPTPESILASFRERGITFFPCVPLFFYRFHERVLATIAARSPLKRRVAGWVMSLSRFGRRRLKINLGKRLLGVIHAPFGSDLRMMFTGGAKMNPDVAADLLDWGFPLIQGYGLTEATAALTVMPADELRPDSVGRPLQDVELGVRNPGSDGVGEIWARTPTLMRGYYKNEEATDYALVDGWLRTGDLGRLNPDGHLTVTGRAKDVIVLASGKNVYPEELDEHFSQSEFIAEICVVGREDSERQGAERLHAVVVPDLEAARRKGYVNVREMVLWELENLGQQLPSWQRPTSFSLRTEPLPRTTTRKVRRFEVQEIVAREGLQESARPVLDAGDEPEPQDDLERQVLAQVARRAGSESVRRGDHLDLDLGLDSLDRVELITEAAARLGVQAGPEMTAAVHTVGELIEALRAAPPAQAEAAPVPRDEDEHWRALLAEAPDEYEPYLERRPVGEAGVFALSRVLRGAAKLRGFRVTGLENLPAEGPFLICPNHTSYLDPIAVTAALPRGVLARSFFVGFSEYFTGRVGRVFSRVLRNIPVDQNRHMERSLQAAAEGLRRGLTLVVFPEGGRSIDGRVATFRRGPAVLARLLRVPMVPVGIWGAYEAWPREGRLRPHPIALAFGAPLDAATASGHESSVTLSEDLRQRVIELVEQARREFQRPEGPVLSADPSERGQT